MGNPFPLKLWMRRVSLLSIKQYPAEYSRVLGSLGPGFELQKGKVGLSTACISRAGREPGFKKQNQDNCFAFEKYMQDGHALFGAFDGHGPEGDPPPFPHHPLHLYWI